MKYSKLTDTKAVMVFSLALVLCLGAILTSLTGAPLLEASDGPPSLPHAFYGTVTVNDQPAPAGTTVEIYVGGSKAATTTTDSNGKYGSVPVTGTNGAAVEFYVNGVKVPQSYNFSSGAITKLDLALNSSSPPTPPPPPPPPPPPAPPAPPSPPPSPTPTGRIAISTRILGQSNTLWLTQTKAVERDTLLTSSDGSVSLEFKANTSVTIAEEVLSVVIEPSPPSPPAGRLLLAAYKFSPAGTTFSPAIVLTVKYDPGALPSDVLETSLHIAYWDGSAWQSLTSQLNTGAKTVSAEINHFSIFALMGMKGQAPAPSPAKFDVVELKVVPAKVKPGETVAIVATVSNTGQSTGNYTAILKINGQAEAEETLTLGAGETKAVTFAVNKQESGTYEVSIGDKSSTFTVVTQPTTTTRQQTPWLPVIALGAGILLVIVLLVIIVRRLTS